MSAPDPIDAGRLHRLLVQPGELWQRIRVVDETESTNSDLVAAARAGEVSGSVLLTEFQSAGKGRLNRIWTAPPGSGIAMSILVHPFDVALARWTWMPLISGLAVAEALRRAAEVPADLKWPNDVMINGRKVCGILAERVETPHGPACVIGIGVNVGLTQEQLPVPTATSLKIEEAATLNRDTIVATILRAFALIYGQWQSSDDDAALAASYLSRCSTIGRQVRVVLGEDRTVEGVAEAIDASGQLIVRTESGSRSFGAGDVIHLR